MAGCVACWICENTEQMGHAVVPFGDAEIVIILDQDIGKRLSSGNTAKSRLVIPEQKQDQMQRLFRTQFLKSGSPSFP